MRSLSNAKDGLELTATANSRKRRKNRFIVGPKLPNFKRIAQWGERPPRLQCAHRRVFPRLPPVAGTRRRISACPLVRRPPLLVIAIRYYTSLRYAIIRHCERSEAIQCILCRMDCRGSLDRKSVV